MKKTNLTPAAPAVAPKPSQPVVEETKAPMTGVAMADMTKGHHGTGAMASIRDLSIEQLRAMRSNVNAELKRRDEELAAKAPKKGDVVRIEAKGRFHGKVGTVVISRKTKAFVEVEGIDQPAYCSHAELVKVEG